MRESFWLFLRNTGLGRWLRKNQKLARALHRLGAMYLPSTCRVRSGPSAGLLLKPSPKWTSDSLEGSYEPEVQKVVSEASGPGAVFYDVGGGFGLFSLLAARQGADVFVFEPLPANAASIAEHARLNGLETSVHVVQQAAHSASGHIRLTLAYSGSQMAPATAGVTGVEETIEVSCVALDEFVRSHPAPTVIKVDVEGAEAEVLRGAEEVFEQQRPRLICEVHDAKNRELVTEWLGKKGYSWRWLEPPSVQPPHLLGEPQEAGEEKAGAGSQ